MGQTNLSRTEFQPAQIITSSYDSVKQLLAFTAYFKTGDIVDIVAKNARGCYIGSALAENLTVCGVISCEGLIFDTSVDTSTALPLDAVGWYAIAKNIDDGQSAIDRLYQMQGCENAGTYQICEDIVTSVSGFPVTGQTTLYVNDVNLFRIGDEYEVSCSGTGIKASGLILDVQIAGDEIHNMSHFVIDKEIDLSGDTGCAICSTGLSIVNIIQRLQENIDKIDQPVENEYIGQGNCDDVAFETSNLFLRNTSKLLLDGRRLRLGDAGTRASLTEGSGNGQLIFTSLVLGTNGNAVKVRLVNAAGTAVTVTGHFEDANMLVSVNNGSGTATAHQIANALNLDADAMKLVQVQYGGDGTGIPAPFAATPLAGGLNDGEGDYAEIPPIVNNFISMTGYQWLCLWILPADRNRLSSPPVDSEELVVDYRKALTNA